METAENLKLLGLTKKEQKVLLALQEGINTPLKITRETKVSRTAVYAILQNLKKRGLAVSHIVNRKKYWSVTNENHIERELYATKRTLLNIPEGREEIRGLSDATVIVHRGAEATRKVLGELLSEHKSERFYAFAGDAAAINWSKIFNPSETNKFNRTLKKNNIIAETILQDGWLQRETNRLGIEWAEEFEGRTTRVNTINGEYFQHGAQMFIFRHSIYLISLGEEIIIEIRNSEIQKMILSFFRFMQENSKVVDANELLRDLIARSEEKHIA
jgi:DNA-binding MarR family transcriptional regulator